MNNKNSIYSNSLDKRKKKIKAQPFGKIGSNEILLFTLNNSNGITIKITNYGGIITSLAVPDKKGKKENIVLGYDNLEEYLKKPFYYGAIIGRYSNRIANGTFLLNNKQYQLSINDYPNHIHGGIIGFNNVIWNANPIEGDDFIGLELSYLSKDMEQGYPGNLTVKVKYILTNNNELKIDYFATTDKETIINLTQHSYFNLSGNLNSEILNHYLKINADKFLPINKKLIPKGDLESVKHTPFDFTAFEQIGARLNDKHVQLGFASGYDHTWVLNKKGKSLRKAAIVYHKESGRCMELFTTKPGIQFYSGNFLCNSDNKINGNIVYKRKGFCLETQYFPNSPNEPSFPSTVLLPGEQYKESTVFKFSNDLGEQNNVAENNKELVKEMQSKIDSIVKVK